MVLEKTEKTMILLDEYAEMIMKMQWLQDLSRNRDELKKNGDNRGWDAFCLFHDFAHLGSRLVLIVRELETRLKPDGSYFNALVDSPEDGLSEIKESMKKEGSKG